MNASWELGAAARLGVRVTDSRSRRISIAYPSRLTLLMALGGIGMATNSACADGISLTAHRVNAAMMTEQTRTQVPLMAPDSRWLTAGNAAATAEVSEIVMNAISRNFAGHSDYTRGRTKNNSTGPRCPGIDRDFWSSLCHPRFQQQPDRPQMALSMFLRGCISRSYCRQRQQSRLHKLIAKPGYGRRPANG